MAAVSWNKDIPEFYTHNRHIYAFNHPLNTIDVFLPKDEEAKKGRVWVVYVHGGAWRAPDKDSMTILPALHKMDPSKHGIPGVASINYGLSPYPNHPTMPSQPNDPSRNNMHPRHLEDVVSALAWLQHKFHIGTRYILAGHSCGATLAFQVLTRSSPNVECLIAAAPRPPLPMGVVGLNGIYDLCQLLQDFQSIPMYAEFLEAAFGKNECGKLRIASPVGWPYKELWSTGRVVLLAHSDEDKLVNWKQTELMSEHLWRSKREYRRDVVLKTKGNHDEIWQQGDELARILLEALKMANEEPLTRDE